MCQNYEVGYPVRLGSGASVTVNFWGAPSLLLVLFYGVSSCEGQWRVQTLHASGILQRKTEPFKRCNFSADT